MKALILSALLATGPAFADVSVTFSEGAPVDRFTFSPEGGCPIGAVDLVVDLTGSAGKLIFDTTERGAGVEVYQPFVLVTGAEQVAVAPQVRDGDRAVRLALDSLSAPLGFTIDVDDTIGAREITVAGGEISGATVTLSLAGEAFTGVFDETARARIALPACTS